MHAHTNTYKYNSKQIINKRDSVYSVQCSQFTMLTWVVLTEYSTKYTMPTVLITSQESPRPTPGFQGPMVLTRN